MRRNRHRLTVSTFPFLAVLLGAMGSLIFLLLIMDRRAKIVARNKVRELQETRLAEVSEAARRRQAAWEKQRDQLHQALEQEELQWRGQLAQVQNDLASVAKQADAEAEAQRTVLAALAREQDALAAARSRLEQQRASLMQSAQLEETTRTEMARLTRELLELEQTADVLKRLKQQVRQPAFSLVPYRGQRGASRVPIYVECTHTGLVFLPDHARLLGPELDVSAFRAEVERRHGPLVKEQGDADPFRTPESAQPYVLFLVRPDGIPTYYRAQRALGGYQIDFGYELVDADWKLEVPTAAQVAQLAIEEPKTTVGQVSNLPGVPGGQRLAAGAGMSNSPGGARPSGARPSGAGRSAVTTLNPPISEVSIPGATAKTPPGVAKDNGADRRVAAPSGPSEEPNRGEPVTRPAGLFKKDGAAAVNPALGSRDFVIDVACYADGVVVTPGGAAFNFAKAADATEVEEKLVRNVVRVITSRQATVRPGDAAYRPVLRFVVHPEGLRSMYRVYPLLERIGVAMIRENVEE